MENNTYLAARMPVQTAAVKRPRLIYLLCLSMSGLEALVEKNDKGAIHERDRRAEVLNSQMIVMQTAWEVVSPQKRDSKFVTYRNTVCGCRLQYRHADGPPVFAHEADCAFAEMPTEPDVV